MRIRRKGRGERREEKRNKEKRRRLKYTLILDGGHDGRGLGSPIEVGGEVIDLLLSSNGGEGRVGLGGPLRGHLLVQVLERGA